MGRNQRQSVQRQANEGKKQFDKALAGSKYLQIAKVVLQQRKRHHRCRLRTQNPWAESQRRKVSGLGSGYITLA